MEPKQILKHLIVRDDAFGVQTPAGWKTVERKLTDADLEAHMNGIHTIGFFTLDSNSKTRWVAFDFDKDSPDLKAEILWHKIQETEYAKSSFIVSTGGRDGFGRHIFILIANLIPGTQARSIGKKLLLDTGFSDDTCDLFPRQGKVSEEVPFGNFIRAPFGFHPVAGKWSQKIHEEALKALEPIMLVPDEQAAEEKELDTRDRASAVPTVMALGDFPCWRLMESGVPEGARDETGFIMAQRKWRQLRGDADGVMASMIAWNSKNQPPLSDKDLSKLVKQGSKPYDLGCTSVQQNNILAPYCVRERCPIGRKQIAEEEGGRELLNDPEILTRVEQRLDETIVGQRESKITAFLVLLSAVYGEPLHVVLRARTAAGKSHVMKKVLELFPTDMIIPFSRVTAHFLEYSELNLDGKILSVDELNAVEDQEQLRLLLSEGRLRLGTTEKTDDGRLSGTIREIPGKAVFISTTTDLGGDEEFKNRTLTVPLDESLEQIKRVARQYLNDETEPRDSSDPVLFQNAIRSLRKMRVLIPLYMANAIDNHYPYHLGYANRDMKKLVALIKMSAFLHQRMRATRTIHDKNYIIASSEDAKNVFEYCLRPIATTVEDMHPVERNVVKIIKEFETQGKDATQRVIALKVGRSVRQTRNILEHLSDLGFIAIDETRRPNKYFVQMDVTSAENFFQRIVEDVKLHEQMLAKSGS